jgi:hypothetical protein
MGAALSVAAGGGLFWHRYVTNPEIRVQPEEISFVYQTGDPIPQSRQFRIEAGASDQEWKALSSAPWARISSVSGKGSAELFARVDPTGLPAKEYISETTVTSGSARTILRVRLRITEPPPLKPPDKEFPPPEMSKKKTGDAKERADRKSEEDKKAEDIRAASEKKRLEELKRAEDGRRAEEEAKRAEAARQADEEAKKGKKDITPPPPPTPLPPRIDCQDPRKGVLEHSKLTWNGVLDPGEVLTITAGRPPSSGSVKGTPLPGCPVTISLLTEGRFETVLPSEADNFRQVRITNKSNRQVNAIQLEWHVTK